MDFEGRYRIIRRIGDGGMGTVHEAYDEKLGKAVAIKILNPHQLNPKQMKRLRVEAQALGAVSHANIVNILAYQTLDDGVPFLVMDFIDGETLDKRAPLDDSTFRRLFCQISDALAHAHEQGIVHRDLKPSNIMVTTDGDARILDFGVSKILGIEDQRLTRTGEVVGTPHYISPEQCTNSNVDARSDIYLLGLCMYFALTGRNPYTANTTMELVMKQASEPLDCSVLPETYRGLVERCTAKDPEQRFQTASEISAVLKGEVSAPSHMARRAKPTDSQRLKLGLLAVAAIVLAITAAGYGVKFLENKPPDNYDADQAVRNVLRVELLDYGPGEEGAMRQRVAVSRAADEELKWIDEAKYPLQAASLYNTRARFTPFSEQQPAALARDYQRSISLSECVLSNGHSSPSERQKATQFRADGEMNLMALDGSENVSQLPKRIAGILEHCREASRNGMRRDYKRGWLFTARRLHEAHKGSDQAGNQLALLETEIAKLSDEDAVLNDNYFMHANPMHLGPNIHRPLELGK